MEQDEGGVSNHVCSDLLAFNRLRSGHVDGAERLDERKYIRIQCVHLFLRWDIAT